jgi:sugar phosphate isomerase/epimerase
MVDLTRRTFTCGAAFALASLGGVGTLARRAAADPLGLPIGLQLYTVGDDLQKDFEGTMKTVAQIGYRQIESSLSAGGKNAKQISDFAKSLGLGWRSIHTSIPELQGGIDKIIEQAHGVGIEYIICAAPWVKDPSRIKPLDPSDPLVKAYGKYAPYVAVLNALTLDDWHWCAETFNTMGEKVKKAGMTFGYHNHNFEFKKIGDALPYDDLIRLTDPQYVSFELDCGWMVSGGYDPVAYLTKYPKRYHLLHIKDLAANQPKGGAETTEVGSGMIDWKAIFKAAGGAAVTGYYVEQEPPYKRPPLESARISHDYLRSLSV